jgi:hypothetical protein
MGSAFAALEASSACWSCGAGLITGQTSFITFFFFKITRMEHVLVYL